MKTKLIFIVVLAVSFLPASAQTNPRFVHEPDLRKILPKFLTTQGFLDPKFAEAIAKPFLYYSDFYGIQALGNTTKANIKKDLTPKFAEIVAEDETSITLRFKAGYSGKFYPNSALKVMDVSVNFDHVEISGDTWADLLKNLDSFRNLLITNGLSKRYLVSNPHYKDEVFVAKQLANKKEPLVVPTITLDDFAKEKNAILLYPEGVHGNLQGYDKLKADVLDKQKFDWIGMEMLMPSQQKDLDVFVRAVDGSPEYLRTRNVFLEYFKDAWNGRSGPKVPAADLYYFKMAEQMRSLNTRVIGIEKTSVEYILFRYGESRFGGAVRSLWWAQALPRKGKGLVFGGSAHFTDSRPINFQDLQKTVNPKVKMFVLDPIKIRKSS